MSDAQAMFRRAWITAGQGELWNCGNTYCTVPYENLPQVERATDDLGWLEAVTPELRRVIDGCTTLNSSDNKLANLERIVSKAQNLSLTLPEPFLRFIGDAGLQSKVPTCTACFLELSDDFVPVPEAAGHFLLRFLNDSQSCIMWYLAISPKGTTSVVASGFFFEPEIFDVMEYEEVKREDAFREAFLCADTFTEFLYRFWVENSIWYSLHKGLPLTPFQEDYRNQITEKL